MGRPKKTEEGCFLSKAAATLAIVPVKVSPVVAVVDVGLLGLKAKKAPTRQRPDYDEPFAKNGAPSTTTAHALRVLYPSKEMAFFAILGGGRGSVASAFMRITTHQTT